MSQNRSPFGSRLSFPDHSAAAVPTRTAPPAVVPQSHPIIETVSQRVRAAREPAKDTATFKKVKDAISHNLLSIDVEQRARLGDVSHSGVSPEESLAHAIRAACAKAGIGLDAVLGVSLGGVTGCTDVVRCLWPDALEAYSKHPLTYEALPGDLVPADLKEAAGQERRRTHYVSGANPTAAADWPAFLERQQARRDDPAAAVRTGLASLDRALGGGLRGLTVLGGPTGVGKTSLAVSIARSGLQADPTLAVLIVELDMRKDDIYGQLLAAEQAAAGPRPPSGQYAPEPPGYLARLRVVDATHLPPPGEHLHWQNDMISWMTKQYQSLFAATGARTVLLVVDYLQRLEVPGITNELDRDAERLKFLTAVQYGTTTPLYPAGMPILVVSKVPKGRGPTQLTPDDLHGDSGLAYSAGTILFLEPDNGRAAGQHTAPVTLSVAKGRDGVTRGRHPLDFAFTAYTFREAATTSPGPPVPAGGAAGSAKAKSKGAGPSAYTTTGKRK